MVALHVAAIGICGLMGLNPMSSTPRTRRIATVVVKMSATAEKPNKVFEFFTFSFPSSRATTRARKKRHAIDVGNLQEIC
jgi:hypothetical protein